MKTNFSTCGIAALCLQLAALPGHSQEVVTLKDINIDPVQSSGINDSMISTGTRVFIASDDDIVGSELWSISPSAAFNAPLALAVDQAKNVYVADTASHTIRKITEQGLVSTFAGNPGISGSTNGVGMAALFSSPRGIAVQINLTNSAVNGTIYVADTANHVIRKITPRGTVVTLAGLVGQAGSNDGTRDVARFSSPEGITVTADGVVYVADTGNHTIRQILANGNVITYAGTAGQVGSTNAIGLNARFNGPKGLVIDSSSNLFIADSGNHTIRRINDRREVITLAGTAGQVGSTDATGAAARFSSPRSLSRDSAGNLFVADQGNHTIRRVTQAGAVTTLIGAAGQTGSSNAATGAASRLNTPSATTVDTTGVIYIADTGNHLIRRSTNAGVVTLYAGRTGVSGTSDGSAISTAGSDTLQLVKDILPGRDHAEPQYLTAVGNSVYFTAVDATGQRDLWISDGTNAGTIRLGRNEDYSASFGPEDLINVNGTVYFAGATIAEGRELWKSNGTVAGTSLVLDINTLPGESSLIRDMVAFNNKLIFVADDAGTRVTPAVGAELWNSTGTNAGTALLSNVFPGSDGSTRADARPSFTPFNGRLYFAAESQLDLEPTGSELCRTTGLTGGHEVVKDISLGSGGSSPSGFAVSGAGFSSDSPGTLFFVADTSSEGRELWKTDGTTESEGTVLVKDIRPGLDSSDIQNLTPIVVNTDSGLNITYSNRVVFSADNGTSGKELWISDGTSDGTFLLKEITSGENGSILANFVSLSPGLVLFTAQTTEGGVVSLWRTNGTSNGTYLIEDFLLEPDASKQSPVGTDFRSPVVVGSRVYFMLGDDEIWVTNGVNDEGTEMIHRFRSGTRDSEPSLFSNVQSSKVVFAANSPNEGVEPWITDGTQAGTTLLNDIVPGPSSSLASNFTAASGDRFYFTAEDASSDRELYFVEGTNVTRLKNINASGSSFPSDLFWHSSGNMLLFAAASTVNNLELWRSNGTEAGTVLLKDLNAGSLGDPASVGSSPSGFTAIGNVVYFAATDFDKGRELYRTDGSAANTRRVKDISASGQNSANPDEFVVMPATGTNRRLYFVATGSGGLNGSQETGRELWRSDGSESGTIVVKDIQLGSTSSITDKAYLTVVGSTLYFVADDGRNGRELWKTNGSAASTKMVRNINNQNSSFGTSNNGSDPTDLINVNGRLFFLADDGINGRELWVSNGTSAGTVRVTNLVSGSGDGQISDLTVVGDVLCFAANNGVSGREVWFSDGTAAGTKVLVDIVPGSGSSNPSNLFNYQGNLLFSASDNSFGAEPRFVFMRPSIVVEQPLATPLVSGVSEIDYTADGDLAFGSGKSLTFTIRNAGINNLKNISTQISGLHAADFSVVTKAATTIKGSRSSNLVVRFTPKEGGERQALLTIRSSDTATPQFTIRLTGGATKNPTVAPQPVHQMVKVGDDVNFTSGATGTLPMTVQWRRNNTAVAGAVSNPLYLWAAKLTDAGSYTAQFKNSASPGGTGTSDKAELGVVQDFSPARIIKVRLNNTATISVSAAGNALTYLWKRSSGVPLSEDARFSGITSRTLTLKTAQLADAMTYFCEVTGPGGTVNGGSTALQVFDAPPVLEVNQNIAVGVVGSFFRHEIKLSSGSTGAATTFGSSRLPPGLKLDTKTGVISGVPTAPNNYPINLTASNGISPAPAPLPVTIVIVNLPSGLDGVYSGLVSRDLEINNLAGGRSDITVTKSGGFSGAVVLAGTKYSFKGNLRFGVDAGQTPPVVIPPFDAEVTIARKGISAPLTLTFTIDPTAKNRFLSASLTSVNISGDVAADVTGWKVTTTPSRYAGRYHMGIRIPDGDANLNPPNADLVPQGNGFATFTVGSRGTLSIAGRTADGEKITCATFVGPSGEVLLYQSLYTTARKGSLLGQLNLRTGADEELPSDNIIKSNESTFDWVRPVNPAALSTKSVTRTYRQGFGLETPISTPVALEAFGGFYTVPAVLLNISAPSATIANASLTFTGAGVNAARLEPDLPDLAITSASAITRLVPATAATSIKASRSTGAISGSFTLFDDDTLTAVVRDTEIKRVVPFQGLIVPEDGIHKGVGYFMLPQIPPAATATRTSQILSGKFSFLAD